MEKIFTDQQTDISTETEDATRSGGSNILIAYFSVMETDGVDTVADASRVAVNGEVLEITSTSHRLFIRKPEVIFSPSKRYRNIPQPCSSFGVCL